MALATVGVNVYLLRTSAVLWGGVMAGLAGASLSLGSLNVFTNGMSANKGFLAYAGNRFGQWTPGGAYFASLLFGGMEALRIRLQALDVPPQFLQMLPYVITVIVLTIMVKRSRVPKTWGAAYDPRDV